MRPRRRRRDPKTSGDILTSSTRGTPWAFVDGSISISASILMANALARCDRCGGWPAIGFLKRLTEQEDGVIIAGMALLFPTALAFYLGVKMIFAAYQDYKRWWEAYQEERLEQGRAEGRREERARMKRELQERGVSLDPEAEQALFGESETRSD